MSFHRSSGWVEETTSWCRFFSQRATQKSNRLSLRSLLDGHLGCIRCIPHFHIPDTTVSNLISPDFVINLYGVVPTSISIPTDSRSQQPMRLLLKSSGSGLIGETHPANQNQFCAKKQADMTYRTNPVHREFNGDDEQWWTRSLWYLCKNSAAHTHMQRAVTLGACPSFKLKSVPELKRHKLHHFTSQVKAGNDRKHLYFMGKTMEKPCPVKHIIQSSTQSGHQKWPTGKSSVLVWLVFPYIYVHINRSILYIYICT